jgi:hypothetical protein
MNRTRGGRLTWAQGPGSVWEQYLENQIPTLFRALPRPFLLQLFDLTICHSLGERACCGLAADELTSMFI